jgi:hypothetical protein
MNLHEDRRDDVRALEHTMTEITALALAKAGCKQRREGGRFTESECPSCREGFTIALGAGPLSCAGGCSSQQILAALSVLETPVPSGSHTSQNQGGGIRFQPLKGGTGTGTGSRGVEKPTTAGTTLPSFETLDGFIARAEQLPDPQWLIEDLVPDSGRVLLAAAPSAGKTFLALIIARFAAAAGRLVYLVLEEGNAKATAGRFRSLRFPDDAQILVLHQAGITLGQHALQLAGVLQRGTDGPAPVLVLDPFASVFRGNENETEQVAAAVSTLDLLMRADPRLLLVIPHHTSKAGERGEMGDPMHAARGGTGLPAWADVQINLKHVSTPKGSGRIEFDALMAKNRDGERDYSIRVCIELGTGEVMMQPAGDAKREAKNKDLRERLLTFIEQATAPLTKNAICAAVSGNKREKLELIDALTSEGVLTNPKGLGWELAAKDSKP